MEPPSSSNDDQTRYQAQDWNGPKADHWLVHERRYEPMLAPFTRLVLGVAAVARTDPVLDVGCGTGSTTCTAARDADDSQALGVDISRPLLLRAEQRARQDGLPNGSFEHGDAHTYRLAPGGFDVAISGFGVLFFSDAAAEFANLARGLRTGGQLVFVCWQGLVDNQWVTVPAGAAAHHLPLPSLTEPGSPGPFSLSDRHHLAAVLDAAGLVDVAIEPVAEPLWLGRDAADTVEFFTASGIGQTLLQDADPATSTRGHGGGAGRAGGPPDLRRCSTRIPGAARHRPQPPVSQRDPRGDQAAGDDRSGAPVRSRPRHRGTPGGMCYGAPPIQQSIPSIALHLDLTKHGQVPKLCRRIR